LRGKLNERCFKMNEFVQVTPGMKKMLEYLKDLKPFEHVDIKISENGEVDTFIIVRTVKVSVKISGIKYLK
jgi:hypothetical protein